jgi:hypothetical protein
MSHSSEREANNTNQKAGPGTDPSRRQRQAERADLASPKAGAGIDPPPTQPRAEQAAGPIKLDDSDINLILVLVLIVLGVAYYWRHLEVALPALAKAAFGAGGVAALLALTRGFIASSIRWRFAERYTNGLTFILRLRGLRVIVLILIGLLALLCAITSSVYELYDVADEKREFDLQITQNGVPFAPLTGMQISGSKRSDGRVFLCNAFAGLAPRLAFTVLRPAGVDGPEPTRLFPFTRIRITFPNGVRAPDLHLLEIIPGPRMLQSLPGAAAEHPPTRYYLEVSVNGKEARVLGDWRRGLVETGAEDLYLSTQPSSGVAGDIGRTYKSRFSTSLSQSGVDMLASNVTKLGTPRFKLSDKVSIAAGQVDAAGNRLPSVATASSVIDHDPIKRIYLERSQ